MATTKTQGFSKDEILLAEIAGALAHPARIRILRLLAERKACICGDLVDRLPLAQSTVSQHLKELKRVGLIHGEIEGPKVCYCVDLRALERVRGEFSDLFLSLCEC